MISEAMKRRDTLKPWYVFRSAVTGQFVGRVYALLNPRECVKERRWK